MDAPFLLSDFRNYRIMLLRILGIGAASHGGLDLLRRLGDGGEGRDAIEGQRQKVNSTLPRASEKADGEEIAVRCWSEITKARMD